MSEASQRIGIVGAGITGLALSYYLDRHHVDHVVLEADDRPGGQIRSSVVEGRLLEHGPQRTRLTEPLEDLVEDLGLRDETVTGDPTLPMYVYAAGKLSTVPISIMTFLTTDLLSRRGKLRVLAEPLTRAGREDETVADLFTRKFGTEAYENVVGPLFRGLYGSDPAAMPAGYAPSPIIELERESGSLLRAVLKAALEKERKPPLTFDRGLEQFPRALYRAVADRVQLERPVTSVRSAGDGFVLETDSGQEEAVDRVVLTTPADAAGDILEALEPDASERLRRLNYNPLAVVHLYADTDREGFGYQVRRDEDLQTLGVFWNAKLFDRHGVYTAFLGGMDDPEILEADNERLGRIAAEDFETVMDERAEVLDITRLQRGFPAWDFSWDALQRLELPDGLHLAANYTARSGLPSRVREAKDLAAEFTEGDSA